MDPKDYHCMTNDCRIRLRHEWQSNINIQNDNIKLTDNNIQLESRIKELELSLKDFEKIKRKYNDMKAKLEQYENQVDIFYAFRSSSKKARRNSDTDRENEPRQPDTRKPANDIMPYPQELTGQQIMQKN
jgi:exonuclease VII small subunit